MDVSVTDLRVLQAFLLRRKLKYRVGSKTKADGSCMLHSLIQNMFFFSRLGLWSKEIPASVHDLRRRVIEFMLSRKRHYIGYKDTDGNEVHGPLNEESFARLIADQSKENSYCDEEGFFVEAACLLLDVEFEIVVTSIDTPVLHSGLGGPVQRINSGEGRLVFCAGLIRDDQRKTGHYQFIIKDDRETREEENSLDPDSSRGESYNISIKYQSFIFQLLFQYSRQPLLLRSSCEDPGSLETI